MKIEFTREEYRHLLDMLYMADWVLTAHKVGADPKVKAYEDLGQKVRAYVNEMGFEDLMEYSVESGKYYPSGQYEETSSAREFIEEFESDTFWEELISRLADRDLIKQAGGVEKLSKLSFEKRIKILHPLEIKYSIEFENNGLDRISIVDNGKPF